MSFQHVIQDSDYEEDAGSEVATSIDPLQDSCSQDDGPEDRGRDVDSHWDAGAQKSFQAPMSNPELPQIDFDRYLQSEFSAIGDHTSSSQQRREDRWIPTEDGGAPVAALVSNTHDDYRQDNVDFNSTDGRLVTPNGSQDAAYVELPPAKKIKRHEAGNDDVIMVQAGTSVIKEDAVTTFDNLDSLPLNEDALMSTLLLPPLDSHSADNERDLVHFVHGGSESLQGENRSPPPTEPFPSSYSPGLKIPKSDLVDRDSMHTPITVQAEQCVLVETEIITAKKKRGRPKKQSVGGEVEEDMKEPPDGAIEIQESTNKRRPGRPKKQEVVDESKNRDSDDEEKLPGIEAGIDSPVLETTERPAKPAKKRKIKRGKTTSAVLSKAHGSDIEDDVLWIEDRPMNQADRKNIPVSKLIKLDGDQDNTGMQISIQDEHKSKADGLAGLEAVEATASESKKRGRKRKKTNPELTTTELPAGHEFSEEPIEIRPKNATNVLQDISNLTTSPTESDTKPKNTYTETLEVIVDPQQDDDEDEDIKSTINVGNMAQSPEKFSAPTTPDPLQETPKKRQQQSNDGNASIETKGPDKHSPIAKTSKAPYRVGLSRRARIAPLLKVVRK